MTRKQRGIRTTYLLQLLSAAVALSAVYFFYFAFEHRLVWGRILPSRYGCRERVHGVSAVQSSKALAEHPR